MADKQPENLQQARQEARRRRRRKLMLIRTAIVVAVLLVLALVGTLVVMKIVGTQQSKKGETTTFLAVETLYVEGDTRYSEETILETSGLYVGQSLLGINKVQAHDRLLKELPYLSTVEISNTKFNTIRIRVTETQVMAAVQVEDGWMIAGDNNQALEHITDGEPPKGILRVVGATLEGQQVGSPLMDERSLRICRLVAASAQQYGLEDLTTVDMTEKTNIFLLLNDRLQVVLGNENKIPEQVEMLVATLPTLYQNNGVSAAGRLDMRTFGDDNPNNDRAIYTPPEVLEQQENLEKNDKTESDKTEAADNEE